MQYSDGTVEIDGIEVSKHLIHICKQHYYQQRPKSYIEQVLDRYDADIDVNTLIEYIRDDCQAKNASPQSEREQELDPTIGNSNVDNSLDIGFF